MYAIKRNVYQGSDGMQVDSLSEVKSFVEYKDAEKVAENCGGRVVRVIRGRKPSGKSRNNQRWMKG